MIDRPSAHLIEYLSNQNVDITHITDRIEERPFDQDLSNPEINSEALEKENVIVETVVKGEESSADSLNNSPINQTLNTGVNLGIMNPLEQASVANNMVNVPVNNVNPVPISTANIAVNNPTVGSIPVYQQPQVFSNVVQQAQSIPNVVQQVQVPTDVQPVMQEPINVSVPVSDNTLVNNSNFTQQNDLLNSNFVLPVNNVVPNGNMGVNNNFVDNNSTNM